jgi:hypothetical protein
MEVLKVFDLGPVIGTLTLVGAVYRVEILKGDDLYLKEFPHGAGALAWLQSMVVTLATDIASKRGQGGRGAPIAHLSNPGGAWQPQAPGTGVKLRNQRRSRAG